MLENIDFYRCFLQGFRVIAYSICIWCGFLAIKDTLPTPTELKAKSRADSDWLKTHCPNLIRYKPSGNYFGRVRGNGKLIRRSRLLLLPRHGRNQHGRRRHVWHVCRLLWPLVSRTDAQHRISVATGAAGKQSRELWQRGFLTGRRTIPPRICRAG